MPRPLEMTTPADTLKVSMQASWEGVRETEGTPHNALFRVITADSLPLQAKNHRPSEAAAHRDAYYDALVKHLEGKLPADVTAHVHTSAFGALRHGVMLQAPHSDKAIAYEGPEFEAGLAATVEAAHAEAVKELSPPPADHAISGPGQNDFRSSALRPMRNIRTGR